MAKRSRVYSKLDWNGGVNTTVDSGLLDDKYTVQADNVVFSTTGARIKREGFSYIDSGVPTPTRAASSGTTKTLYFTSVDDQVAAASPADSRLVLGETINVTGSTDFLATAAAVATIGSRAEVTTVLCVGDTAGSLNNKYFYLNSNLDTTEYYVWFDVDAGGTDPAIAGKTGLQVAISAGDSAATVASALQAVIDAEADFGASVATDTVTITAAAAGPVTDASDAGTTGFTITVTTQGAQTITYTGANSATVSEAANTALTITRAAAVIGLHDYWYFDASYVKQQLLMAYTADKKLFKFDSNGRRTEIAGQAEVTSVVCVADSGGSLNNTYFYLNSANNSTQYYVWYNVSSGGTDPAISGKTGIEVAIATNDANTVVASATQSAINALSDFSASVGSATVTITNASAGAATDASDAGSTGFTITTTTQGATLPNTTQYIARMRTFANKLIISFEDVGDYPIVYDPLTSTTTYFILTSAPDASIMQEHYGRLFANDKTEPDRLHYCAPFDSNTWLGAGDSGAIDIGTDDGDERGITTILPSFKGRLFVAKASKLYQLSGDSPEWYRVDSVSDGIGSLSHTACAAVDQDDLMYMSRRGIHSVAATSSYGDFEGSFLSSDIQPTFNGWNIGDLKYSHAAYIPSLNSVAFSVTERGSSAANAIWLYNNQFKAWYRWPSVNARSLTTRLASSVSQLIFGTSAGRLVSTQNGEYTDFGTTAIRYKVKTGTIYPDKNVQSMKSFRRLTFFYRPIGDFQFTTTVKVDKAPAQSLAFQQESSGDTLDGTFILGSSVLGTSGEMAPYTQTIDGYGRGIVIEIVNEESAEQVAIYGFAVEYVDADNRQEVT